MTNSNAYGFYPDRTKYNLEEHLSTVGHHHVLADIDDYIAPVPAIPDDPSSWENKTVGGTDSSRIISLKDDNKIPVQRGVSYIFDLNTGYKGKIFFNGVDQFPNTYVSVFPKTWIAPADGYVRFQIKRKNDGPISPGNAELMGLEFKPSALDEINEMLRDLSAEEDYEYGINMGGTYSGWLHVHRFGHTLMFQLVAVTGTDYFGDYDYARVDHYRDLYYGDFYRLKEGYTKDPLAVGTLWQDSDFYTDSHGFKESFPNRFLPAFGIGDFVANTDSPSSSNQYGDRPVRNIWVNWADGFIRVWICSNENPDVIYCNTSGCFVCNGKD